MSSLEVPRARQLVVVLPGEAEDLARVRGAQSQGPDEGAQLLLPRVPVRTALQGLL